MPDMDAPGRIGEHLQHVIFRPRIVIFGGEDRLLVPLALPARLGFACVVAFGGYEIAGLFVGLRPVLGDGGLGHKSGWAVNGLGGLGDRRIRSLYGLAGKRQRNGPLSSPWPSSRRYR